jgi:hypothetical protein
MTFHSKRFIKNPRKAHRCVHCSAMIPAGTPHLEESGIWEGEFFHHRMHTDCAALWSEAFADYGDWDDGMALDLAEAIEADETRDLVQAAYDHYRGRFPHVICRLELRWQRGDINGADRLRALGITPDPEDYPEVYG